MRHHLQSTIVRCLHSHNSPCPYCPTASIKSRQVYVPLKTNLLPAANFFQQVPVCFDSKAKELHPSVTSQHCSGTLLGPLRQGVTGPRRQREPPALWLGAVTQSWVQLHWKIEPSTHNLYTARHKWCFPIGYAWREAGFLEMETDTAINAVNGCCIPPGFDSVGTFRDCCVWGPWGMPVWFAALQTQVSTFGWDESGGAELIFMVLCSSWQIQAGSAICRDLWTGRGKGTSNLLNLSSLPVCISAVKHGGFYFKVLRYVFFLSNEIKTQNTGASQSPQTVPSAS